jgi:A/G-specific adenine glycosylase
MYTTWKYIMRNDNEAVWHAGMPETSALTATLLEWYDCHRRIFPWRALPKQKPDPYHVWLSEMMLQQTTTATVRSYFVRFLEQWPSFSNLAAADLDEILCAWAGLGYYARARHLHRCAQIVSERYGGCLPKEEAELLKLPGIGTYTAAAIAAIAFDQPVTVIDCNVERVIARTFAVTDPLPSIRPELRRLAALLTPVHRAGDYAQASMDLGATVCKPRKPSCLVCPWNTFCLSYHLGIAETIPSRLPRVRPTRCGVAFWAMNTSNAVLLYRRPKHGLLGGMMEVPSTPWQETTPPFGSTAAKLVDFKVLATVAPLKATWHLLPGIVRHTFTHFHLELAVAVACVESGTSADSGQWVPLTELSKQALPTVMRKVAQHALVFVSSTSKESIQSFRP